MSIPDQDSRHETSPEFELDPFRMLIIFDSEETSREAVAASNVILRELGEEVTIDKTAWELPALESRAARIEAAEEAARADVIVVALSETEPSIILKDWVARWEGERKLDGGLLALIPSDGSGGELGDFFYETAVTAHMDYLCRQKENRLGALA